MFKFMLGELAVCVFLAVLAGTLLLLLYGIGRLLKTLTVSTCRQLQETLPALNHAVPRSPDTLLPERTALILLDKVAA